MSPEVCAGCWRVESPTGKLWMTLVEELRLCDQCKAQVDSFSKDGPSSEGGKHAARLLATWRSRTEAREAYALARYERAQANSAQERVMTRPRPLPVAERAKPTGFNAQNQR